MPLIPDYSKFEELIVTKKSIFRSFKRFLVQVPIQLSLSPATENNQAAKEEKKEEIILKRCSEPLS